MFTAEEKVRAISAGEVLKNELVEAVKDFSQRWPGLCFNFYADGQEVTIASVSMYDGTGTNHITEHALARDISENDIRLTMKAAESLVP